MDKGIEAVANVLTRVVAASQEVIPNVGAGAAAGTIGAAALKTSTSLPLGQRLVVVGTTAFVGAAATQAGLNLGMAKVKNIDIKSVIKDSPHTDPNVNRIPSPGPDVWLCLPNSPLEKWEIDSSPLEVFLSSILTLNVCVLLLIIVLLYLLFTRYLLSSNKDFIWRSVHY